jgi:hypothetical protein
LSDEDLSEDSEEDSIMSHGLPYRMMDFPVRSASHIQIDNNPDYFFK